MSEKWKVVILAAEMFCFGGSIFAPEWHKAKGVLRVAVIVLGVIYMVVV